MPHQDHGLRKKRLTAVVLFPDCDYWRVFDMMIATMRHPVRFISSAVGVTPDNHTRFLILAIKDMSRKKPAE